LGRSLQGTACLGLHSGDKISDVDIAVELDLIVCCELALLCQLRTLVHTRSISLIKANRQQVFGGSATIPLGPLFLRD